MALLSLAAVLTSCLVAAAAKPAEAATPFGTMAVRGRGIASPNGIAAGPDGNLWFTNTGNESIGRMTPTGELSFFTDPRISSPRQITQGPDGNLWFTNYGDWYTSTADSAIGRVTPAGVFSFFTHPAVNSPGAITAGPDGNVWFTNIGSSAPGSPAIGRITPNGEITTFTHPGISSPVGITTGPDGNLWFTGGRIGRITPSGAVTTFEHEDVFDAKVIVSGPDGNLWFTTWGRIGRITPAGAITTWYGPDILRPGGIAAGADGNLWYTVPECGWIGRITPDGVTTVFAGGDVARSIVPGPLGSLWFPEAQRDSIGRITMAGVATHFKGPGISGPSAITNGPDGNVWFTNYENDSIGRISPDGEAVSFGGPDVGNPTGIAAGPDGNLWFTNAHSGLRSLGRITPAGQITSFPLGEGYGTGAITAGPDGNMWFTSYDPDVVGRITTAGVITLFRSPEIHDPRAITAGPDGNVWFTNSGSRTIGRITPAGVVTIFASGATIPGDITTGPDGNLWFTGGIIGRMTPAGVVTTFDGPGIDLPAGIATGPDGNLWFTNWGNDSMGRLTPSGSVISTFADVGEASVSGLAVGPDGDMWFTNRDTNLIRSVGTRPGIDVPGRPPSISAADGDWQATVTWAPPPTDGGAPLTGYTVTSSPDGHTCEWSSGPLSCTVPSLVNGRSYSFTVVATNRAGSGPASPPSNAVVPNGLPGRAWGVDATPGDGQVRVRWTAAPDGGAPVTRYTVRSTWGQTCSWVAGPLECTVTGLANGTGYAFTVVATNQNGAGPESPFTYIVVPASVPGAPTAVTAAVASGKALVSWAAPASDGGAVVKEYRVTASPGGQTCTAGSGRECWITGLSDGTAYRFSVTATNEMGTGPPSALSTAVVPGQPGVAFHPLTPARVLDSRPGATNVGRYSSPWAPGQSRDVPVTGPGGVPIGAQAVVANVTVTGTTTAGYLTVWPTGQARPVASSLNWSPGQTVANAVTVKVGAGGNVSMFNQSGSANVIVDVVGYYDGTPGAGFTPLTPARILDSRAPSGSAWGPSQTRDVTATGVGGVAAGAEAVVVNVTVTGTSSSGYLSIWPAGQARPTVSSLNWVAGQTVANAVTVKVGAGGRISVFNASGSAHVIVDVVGSFAVGSGHLFHPLDPARLLDSRPAGPKVGAYATPWGPNVSREVQVAGGGGVPTGAAAALLNVTATGTTAASYLTIGPAGQTPLASSLNWQAGQTVPNAVPAKLAPNGAIAVQNLAGAVHVIADTAGWYG